MDEPSKRKRVSDADLHPPAAKRLLSRTTAASTATAGLPSLPTIQAAYAAYNALRSSFTPQTANTNTNAPRPQDLEQHFSTLLDASKNPSIHIQRLVAKLIPKYAHYFPSHLTSAVDILQSLSVLSLLSPESGSNGSAQLVEDIENDSISGLQKMLVACRNSSGTATNEFPHAAATARVCVRFALEQKSKNKKNKKKNEQTLMDIAQAAFHLAPAHVVAEIVEILSSSTAASPLALQQAALTFLQSYVLKQVVVEVDMLVVTTQKKVFVNQHGEIIDKVNKEENGGGDGEVGEEEKETKQTTTSTTSTLLVESLPRCSPDAKMASEHLSSLVVSTTPLLRAMDQEERATVQKTVEALMTPHMPIVKEEEEVETVAIVVEENEEQEKEDAVMAMLRNVMKKEEEQEKMGNVQRPAFLDIMHAPKEEGELEDEEGEIAVPTSIDAGGGKGGGGEMDRGTTEEYVLDESQPSLPSRSRWDKDTTPDPTAPAPTPPPISDHFPPPDAYAIKSLWVGNFTPGPDTEDQLLEAFHRCGHIASHRVIPRSCCAFVNFSRIEDAIAARVQCDGLRIGERCLVVEYQNEKEYWAKRGGRPSAASQQRRERGGGGREGGRGRGRGRGRSRSRSRSWSRSRSRSRGRSRSWSRSKSRSRRGHRSSSEERGDGYDGGLQRRGRGGRVGSRSRSPDRHHHHHHHRHHHTYGDAAPVPMNTSIGMGAPQNILWRGTVAKALKPQAHVVCVALDHHQQVAVNHEPGTWPAMLNVKNRIPIDYVFTTLVPALGSNFSFFKILPEREQEGEKLATFAAYLAGKSRAGVVDIDAEGGGGGSVNPPRALYLIPANEDVCAAVGEGWPGVEEAQRMMYALIPL